MASTAIRERRRTLRYRNLLVRQMVQLKIKVVGLARIRSNRMFGDFGCATGTSSQKHKRQKHYIYAVWQP
jgi:hypothetical protein